MILINLLVMLSAAALLITMIIRTRHYDSVGWWLFRILSGYALICFVYLAYDTNVAGNVLLLKYLFMRVGFLALVGAMILSWRLISNEKSNTDKRNFNMRLKDIFNLGDQCE